MSTKYPRPAAGMLILEAIVAFMILGAGVFFFCQPPAPQLPPEKDRAWQHHPIIIDFEHNYEELKDECS